MRIIICGDCHIGATYQMGYTDKNGVNTRITDYEKTLNHIVDYAIENGIDAFIQTGDAFDSRKPTPEHMEILNKALRKLSMANITAIVIMGNHDYLRSGESFTSAIASLAAKDYPNVRLILEPEVLKLTGKDQDALNMLLLPYRDRRMYGGKNTEQDSQAYQEEVLNYIKDCEKTIPMVAIGHNFYFDGSYNDYGGTEILVKTETFSQCDMVAMGHYHQFKIFKRKEPIAFYTGSMEKLNFGDEKIDKYFLDYNTLTKQSKIIKSPTRSLQDLTIDLSNCTHDNVISELKLKLDEFELQDKIVRLRILVRDSLISTLNKNEIEKILYARKSFYVSKVIFEPVIFKVIKDNLILKHKDDLSLFRAFLESQSSMDEVDLNDILTEAKKIIEGQ